MTLLILLLCIGAFVAFIAVLWFFPSVTTPESKPDNTKKKSSLSSSQLVFLTMFLSGVIYLFISYNISIPTKVVDNEWSEKDQAELDARIGLEYSPILFSDYPYDDRNYSSSLHKSVSRKEVLKFGYKSFCQNGYSPQPEPKIINYDTGETEPIVQTPKKPIAYNCQIIRRPDQNPKTYPRRYWWMDTKYNGLTEKEFNNLTRRWRYRGFKLRN